MSYTFIDIFAGAGGLSEGFVRQGFVPIAHVEMDPYASQTLKTRMTYHHLKKEGRLTEYRRYLTGEISQEEFYKCLPSQQDEVILNREISDSTIDDIFKEIDGTLLRKTGQSEKVDILIGGPPCQAYSLVGRARDPYGKEKDPRNHLYKQYVKFLQKYNPEIFIFENVPGILNAAGGTLFKDVENILREVGYEIKAETLNAASFGVLQQRRRVILIGWKKELQHSYPKFDNVTHNYTVNDLLIDLPPLLPVTDKLSDSKYRSGPTSYLEKYGIREENDILTQHITRVHNENDIKIYRIAIQLWEEKKQRLKYTDLPEELKTHKNVHAFLDRFKVVGANLQHSHTMVAHIAKDGHYYIHPFKEQNRSLSVREAARIQSFPDNFYFEGPRTAVFTQIGNAVPPIMAERIAEKVLKMLKNEIEIEVGTDEGQQVLF